MRETTDESIRDGYISSSDSESDCIESGITGFSIQYVDAVVNQGKTMRCGSVFTQMEYSEFFNFLSETILTRSAGSVRHYFNPETMLMVSTKSFSRYFNIIEYEVNSQYQIDKRLSRGEIFLFSVLGDKPKVNFRVFILPHWMMPFRNSDIIDCVVHIYYHMIPGLVTMIEKFRGDMQEITNFIRGLPNELFNSTFSVSEFLGKVSMYDSVPEMNIDSMVSTVLYIGEMLTVFDLDDNRYSVNYDVRFLPVRPI
jgi:hypothetical protein